MKLLYITPILFFLSLFSNAQPFSVSYTFDSVNTSSSITDPTPVPTATGVVFGAFSAVGTPTNPNSTGRFSFINWATGGAANNNNYAAHTGTVDTSEYYAVTITPQSGYILTLNDIEFKVQRSGTGIRTYAVRSSADNYAANMPASFSSANANLSVQTGDIFYWNFDSITSSQSGSLLALSHASFANITAPVTFRFYGWNAEASTGTFSIDNVAFTGFVSASTGINETIEDNFSIYPNPSSNGIFHFYNNVTLKSRLMVYDLLGNLIQANEINSGKNSIDLSDKSNGCYFVIFESNNQTTTKKVIVNK